MRKLAAALMTLALLGCDLGGRAVPQPGEGDDGGRKSVEVARDQGPADRSTTIADRGLPPAVAFDLGPADHVRVDQNPPSAGTGETATCLFLGSTSNHSCYASSSTGSYQCSGGGHCSVKMTSPPGSELIWKSSCGSYAYSVVDGVADTVGFDCSGGPTVLDQVKCEFVGSTKKQSCTTDGPLGPFRCSGVLSCTVSVLTVPGKELVWTSTCSGEHRTTVGGGDTTLSFTCN